MSSETHVVDQDRVTLDLLLWRRYRRRTPGLVEKTLALNPGLADAGPVLPVGTRIIVPVEPMQPEPVMPVISLWG